MFLKGKDSVALAVGYEGKARGVLGCVLMLVERDGEGKVLAASATIVDNDTVKSNVFYMLKDGELIEVA